MTAGVQTEVTFEFDGVAEQVYLCLQPCGERAAVDCGPGDGGGGGGGGGARQTRKLSQRSPGVWRVAVRLQPGWWRFRYYTQERGCLFYAEPSQTVLRMDGLDAMLHVSRAPEAATRRRHAADAPSPSDQYLCVLPEDHHVDAPETGAAEAADFSPQTSAEGPELRDEPAAPDARRHDRRNGRAAFPGCEEAAFQGTQAEALWRRCAGAAGRRTRPPRGLSHAFETVGR
jgi:hypothetical protein